MHRDIEVEGVGVASIDLCFKHHGLIVTKLISIVGLGFTKILIVVNFWSGSCRVCWTYSTGPAFQLDTYTIEMNESQKQSYQTTTVNDPSIIIQSNAHLCSIKEVGKLAVLLAKESFLVQMCSNRIQ